MISNEEVILRLLAALLFCGVVGLQRFLAGKDAGVRTHVLVGVGSALFTIISGYAFHATASNADRIAAQVVTGIGFIGGGAILKERGSVKGLTTAAGLWAVAALGMAAGAGMYAVGGFGAILIVGTLVVLQRAEGILPRRFHGSWEVEVTLPLDVSTESVRTAISSECRKVVLEGLVLEGNRRRISMLAEVDHTVNIDDLARRMHEAGAVSVSWSSAGNAERETSP